MPIRSANDWLSNYLVDRPGHLYWNSRTLDTYDFAYSFVSKHLPLQSMSPLTLVDVTGVITSTTFLAGYATIANASPRTLTTDTAVNLIADLPLTENDDSIEVVIANLSASNALTLAAGAGVTSHGNLTVAASTNVKVRLRRVSATAVSMYIL